jgi:threonine/homoserine/homoserine lactone efflux protein
VDLVSSLPAFVLAVALISVSPGPAMALIIRHAALRGTGGAVPVVLGLEAGLYVWALIAGVGFAALVAASEVAHLVLRVVGAAVLLALGLRAWRAAWRVERQPDTMGERVSPPGHRRWWTAFAEGLLVQLANPKAAVLVLALYPQFVPVDGPVLATTALLGLVQIALETGLYLALAAGVARAGTWFRRPLVRRRLEAVCGTVPVALGLRVAMASR